MTTKKESPQPTASAVTNRSDLSPHLLRMMFDEPFFSGILRIVNIEFGKSIPTAGVLVKDGDVHMLINPDFIGKLTNDEVKGLMKHECFHLAFEHCTTRRLEPHGVANIAADLAINSDIPKIELPEGAMVPGEPVKDAFGATALGKLIAKMPKHKSQEWYFTEIMKDPEAAKQAQDMAGGQGGAGGFDSHEGWDEMTDEQKELVKGKIAQAVAEATKDADRSGNWGSVGAEMRGKIREMVSREVDWKSILKQFVGFSRRGTRSTTWNRINTTIIHPEHGPLATASKRGYTSSIAVYIDQSGSVGNDDLALAFGELRSLSRHTEFTTFHFDTKVDLKSETVWKKGKSPVTHRTRCGGTCFDSVTKHANQNKGKFDGVIIFTDGAAPKPGPSKLKRLYLLVPGTKLEFTPDKNDVVCKMKRPKSDG